VGFHDDEIGRLYTETGHLVLRRCLQILRDPEEALDTVQWTFMRAIEIGFVVRSRGEALSWLYQTASRRCLWMLRNSSQRSRLVQKHGSELADLPQPALEADLVGRDLLVRALDVLTEDAAQLVLMTYVWGYSAERAAQIAGVSVRTVGRARATFEARLRELTAREVVS
jgi:RNA polymerase sigma factor (sigma-70 family)